MQYQKVKSVSKQVITKGPALEKLVLETMKTISSIVGSTLGPGGQPVLIERFEHDLPPYLTKDGVSVFKTLGFDHSSAQCIMEAARDAAVRTANEAGDGTTTATILAEAIVRLTNNYCKKYPRVSPQKVVRKLEDTFRKIIEPTINKLSIKIDSTTDDGRKILKSVAKVSANGDEALADAVIECFDLVGDDGNVTIAEVSGPSSYEVEAIDGFPIGIGYEDSCAKFYQKFINNPGTQKTMLENPVFILYHGIITEIQTALGILTKVGMEWAKHFEGESEWNKHNIILVAIGFSESVLGHLAVNFADPQTINVFPLVVPKFPVSNGQLQFLEDMAAITGAEIFDPLNKPLDSGDLIDLGPGVELFEASRFRSTIIGKASEDLIVERVADLESLLENPESEWDKINLQERVGKLTGGIAKLKVIGASNGELKEKRDRAEDAVCAVKGAMKHGCLPGGGWTLLKLCQALGTGDSVIDEVLKPALMEPVVRLLLNCGIDDIEGHSIIDPILEAMLKGQVLVYDALEQKHIEPVSGGILDSTPAVLEAIRNSISIATLLGTLGGCVCYKRDVELERSEAAQTAQFIKDSNFNEADQRG